MLPVQITIRDISHLSSLEDHIHEKAEKFHHAKIINKCKVVITSPHNHKHQGKLYSVCIDLMVPGRELINRQLNEDVYVAIRDAFDAISRQLDNHVLKRRGKVKAHISRIDRANLQDIKNLPVEN